jgi:hypothetical protein
LARVEPECAHVDGDAFGGDESGAQIERQNAVVRQFDGEDAGEPMEGGF